MFGIKKRAPPVFDAGGALSWGILIFYVVCALCPHGLSALDLPCVTWPLRQLQLELHVVVAGHASHVDKGVAHASQCGVDAHIGGVGNLLE